MANFFDPALAQLQRQLGHQLATGTADLQFKQRQLREDANLMRPYMERKFGRQMHDRAEGVAGQGFHGNNSGVMRNQLGELGEDQALAWGQFERQHAGGMAGTEQAMAQLAGDVTMKGAEGSLSAAGNASRRAERDLPF